MRDFFISRNLSFDLLRSIFVTAFLLYKLFFLFMIFIMIMLCNFLSAIGDFVSFAFMVEWMAIEVCACMAFNAANNGYYSQRR